MNRPALPSAADPQAATPAATQPAPRPRGRPAGARTRVLRDQDRVLGTHHFAFLRSWFQRLDLREAWQRYMAFSEPGHDLRRIARRRAELLRQVLDAGRQIDLSLPAGQRITRQLAVLAQAPQAPAAVALPSLDDFIAAQGLDREFYSEAELLQEYRQHHHLDSAPEPPLDGHAGTAGARAQVRALHQVEMLLARAPAPGDALALWLAPALAQRLHDAGITTLAGLADTLRRGDAGWFRRVRGLGETQAHALVQWLAPLAEGFERAIPAADLVATPAQRASRAAARREAAQQPQFGLVPLERLAAPSRAAQRDQQAILAWLSGHAAASTRRSYTREAERFLLWSLHVRRQPLQSLGPADLEAYAGFLAAPPAEWLQPLAVPRSDAAWRPLRAPLGPASCRHALAVVRSLLAGLTACGHLTGQALAATRAVTPPPRAASRPDRAFTAQEWRFVQDRLAAQTAASEGREGQRGAAEVRRLRLILELLARTGWRLSQLAGATLATAHGRAQQMGQGADCSPGTGAPAAVLRWFSGNAGKGGATREIQPDAQLLAWIHEHHRDAARIADLPWPAPLVCSLGERPRKWLAGSGVAHERGMRAGEGEPVATESALPPAVHALTATGIDLTLKRFFRRAAKHAVAVDGVSPERLCAASAHWARNAARHDCSTVEQGLAEGAYSPDQAGSQQAQHAQ